ncbi:MAG: hypothetical protein PHE50_00185 [Dehalococcoidales bacterium]|nr:hypothetical protein [Dehalococcoidales bacterium]
MKNIVWEKPDKSLAITTIREYPYSLEDVRREYPYASEHQIYSEYNLLLKNWPRDSKHHSEQIIEQAKIDWELNKQEALKRKEPEPNMPEVLTWNPIAFDREIPTDDLLDDARVFKDGKIVFDLDKSKAIIKNKIRRQRESLFKSLDIAFQRHIEDGTDYSDIVKQKKTLRELPDTVDVAKTTEDVKNIWIGLDGQFR